MTLRPTAGERSNGYGLAVAKDLIEKLGGDIWCETKLGKGFRFSFRLPVYEETIHTTSALETPASGREARPGELAAELACRVVTPNA